jgi:hypothetical protein
LWEQLILTYRRLVTYVSDAFLEARRQPKVQCRAATMVRLEDHVTCESASPGQWPVELAAEHWLSLPLSSHCAGVVVVTVVLVVVAAMVQPEPLPAEVVGVAVG